MRESWISCLPTSRRYVPKILPRPREKNNISGQLKLMHGDTLNRGQGLLPYGGPGCKSESGGRGGRWEWYWRWRYHHVKYWGNSIMQKAKYLHFLPSQPRPKTHTFLYQHFKIQHLSSVPNSWLYFIKALLQAIDVLKKEVLRQREEKELLEANVREQVVSEMMEVISEMQEGFRCVSVYAVFTIKVLKSFLIWLSLHFV